MKQARRQSEPLARGDFPLEFLHPDLITDALQEIRPEVCFVQRHQPWARIKRPSSPMIFNIRDYSVHVLASVAEAGILPGAGYDERQSMAMNCAMRSVDGDQAVCR